MKSTVTLNFGVVKIELTQDDLSALKGRFTRNPLYRGPCLIINRDTGLALDAHPDAKPGGHTCLWQPHAAPWQQWRLHGTGGGTIEIISESSGLYLTAMAEGHEWGETWLHDTVKPGWSRQWRIKNTDDGVAFAIQNATSGYALDAGQHAENLSDPHLWPTTHWDPWQQWIIARLPLT
ncbi:hypothetical protein BCD49_37790 [Pseudofrankia sp. EUN1h]|nr:hypothetical protein BCD49_37790 [Pseudofrankia sp. EUN1h]